jgi:hypothetical protein
MKRNAAITKFKPLSQKVLRRLAEDRIIEFRLLTVISCFFLLSVESGQTNGTSPR